MSLAQRGEVRSDVRYKVVEEGYKSFSGSETLSMLSLGCLWHGSGVCLEVALYIL